MLVEGGDAVVVEAGRARAEHRHVLPRRPEGRAVADELAGHVAAGVLRAAPLELVDRDDVGEVEHVDLLELRGRAELGRHDVERDVDQRRDRGVALADARRLDDHQVVAGRLARPDHVAQLRGQLAGGAAGGERAEERAPGGEGVHPDAVAEQGAPAAPAGRVDRDDGDPQLVLLVEPEPPDELVRQRALARAAGPGDAEHGHRAPGRGLPQRAGELGVAPGLEHGDRARQGRVVPGEHGLRGRRLRRQVDVAGGDHGVDHAGEPELLPVRRREDGDPPFGQRPDLLVDDHPAAAAVHAHVPGAALPEGVDEVAEVLQVAALVGADRDTLRVLLQGGLDDLAHAAVVPQVDHLAALRLQDAPHDRDSGVVPVEQAGGGDEADGAGRHVQVHSGVLRDEYSDVR